jgi:hypothetical protein
LTEPAPTELSVQSLPVQTMYGYYRSDRFRVNRRYQRKLVWNVEEKQRLIDSILKGLPIPLILVAEIGPGPDAPYELIDGMQRLNAIFAFIENEYSVSDQYFNLDSLADTKLLKDEGALVQREPAMDRIASAKVVNYSIAISIFRARDSGSVDDVFRRINSSGRRLSRQELRQAGTTSLLADTVRILSSNIRTDTSPSDILPLSVMPKLSITNRDLPYGVNADSIFWVANGILRREEVRSSQDEQAVLDLVLDAIVDPMPNSGTRIRDNYYDFAEIQTKEPTSESAKIESAIQLYDPEKLRADFMRTYDEVRALLEVAGQKFTALVSTGSGGRSPRAFHVIFMAIFELMHKERMMLADRDAAVQKLRGIGESLSISPRGGDWGSEPKRQSIDSVKGVLRSCFQQATDAQDFSRYAWSSHIETLLSNAVVEQQLFDCKQGLLTLAQGRPFDNAAMDKICRTLTAMANRGPGAVGHVVIGIADNPRDASRIRTLDGVDSIVFKGFHIVGVDREALVRKQSAADYYTWIMQKIRTHPLLDTGLAQVVSAESVVANYHGKTLIVLRVMGQQNPFFFGAGKLVDRVGSETVEVGQGGADFMRVFGRFPSNGS